MCLFWNQQVIEMYKVYCNFTETQLWMKQQYRDNLSNLSETATKALKDLYLKFPQENKEVMFGDTASTLSQTVLETCSKYMDILRQQFCGRVQLYRRVNQIASR